MSSNMSDTNTCRKLSEVKNEDQTLLSCTSNLVKGLLLHLSWKVFKISPGSASFVLLVLFVPSNDVLNTGRAKEVFLFQTEFLTLRHLHEEGRQYYIYILYIIIIMIKIIHHHH